jgi:glucose-1-phosphate thymidylyltransferase
MKAILLCAGYATRMYPLTENYPKPLLPIKGTPILDLIIADLSEIPQINQIIVVSNHKFVSTFVSWMKKRPYNPKVKLIDDGSTTNENRLGALKDLQLAIDHTNLDDDVLVLAGDNLYDFSMQGFVDFFIQTHQSAIMIHHEPDLLALQRTGVASIQGSRVIEFQEKPSVPKSAFAVPPFYVYPKEVFPLIRKYLADGNPSDAPGSFISWLCKQTTVLAYEMPGKRIDIGDIDTYHQVR